MAATLTDEEIRVRLTDHPGWELDAGTLHRRFELADFSEAFGFMARVALAAEKLDHHPDWSNSWNVVDVRIRSHSAGGITDTCFALAEAVDAANP